MRTKGILVNCKGLKYVPPRLVEGKTGWYLTYWVMDLNKGKLVERKYYKIPGETPAARRRKAKELIKELSTYLYEGFTIGDLPKEKKPKTLTLLEAIDLAVQIKRGETGERSRQAYSSFQRIFELWAKEKELQNLPIQTVGRSDIYAFLDWLIKERKVSHKTRNNYKILINALMNTLKGREIIEKNPASRIKNLRVKGSRHIPFTREQQKFFETYLKHNEPELFLYTRFIYYGFIRPAEICRMQVGHINLESRIILVRAGDAKNSRQLPVVINPQLYKIIESMNLGRYPLNYHIFGKKFVPCPTPEHRTRFSERHAEALKACNLYNGELTLYGWKHTGNIRAYEAGVDIYSLMSQNRHSNLQETENYLRGLGLRISKELKTKEW
ncbi:MAG: tyrosine-type recombinase/integrase [Bacteroidota bacterium]